MEANRKILASTSLAKIRDVEAEAGGASGGEAFSEYLEAEAKSSKIRLRLHLRLRRVFENFIFNVKGI